MWRLYVGHYLIWWVAHVHSTLYLIEALKTTPCDISCLCPLSFNTNLLRDLAFLLYILYPLSSQTTHSIATLKLQHLHSPFQDLRFATSFNQAQKWVSDYRLFDEHHSQLAKQLQNPHKSQRAILQCMLERNKSGL